MDSINHYINLQVSVHCALPIYLALSCPSLLLRLPTLLLIHPLSIYIPPNFRLLSITSFLYFIICFLSYLPHSQNKSYFDNGLACSLSFPERRVARRQAAKVKSMQQSGEVAATPLHRPHPPLFERAGMKKKGNTQHAPHALRPLNITVLPQDV